MGARLNLSKCTIVRKKGTKSAMECTYIVVWLQVPMSGKHVLLYIPL